MSLMVWAQALGALGSKSLHTAQGEVGLWTFFFFSIILWARSCPQTLCNRGVRISPWVHSSCGGVWLTGSLPISLQRLELLPAAHFSFSSFLLTPVRKPEDEILCPVLSSFRQALALEYCQNRSWVWAPAEVSGVKQRGWSTESLHSCLFQRMAFSGTGTQGHQEAAASCTKLLCQPKFWSGSSTWIVSGSHQSYSGWNLAAKSDSCS